MKPVTWRKGNNQDRHARESSRNLHDGPGKHTNRHSGHYDQVLLEPAGISRVCHGACHSRPSTSKPAHPTEPGSSAPQNLEHTTKRRPVNIRADNHPADIPDNDLHLPARGSR